MLISTAELRTLEVVNIVDGRRLGAVHDLELDLASGRITRLILPGSPPSFFRWWQGSREVAVPWENIVKIGIDVILVRVPHLADDHDEPPA